MSSNFLELDVVHLGRLVSSKGSDQSLVYAGDNYPEKPIKSLCLGRVASMYMKDEKMKAYVHVRPLFNEGAYHGATSYLVNNPEKVVILATKKCFYFMDKEEALYLETLNYGSA